MQATPTMDMRENRAPMRCQARASFTRLSAIRKHGMPPIQIAAPNWCSASTASSSKLSDIRAAAWVLSVAAASSTTPSASSTEAGTARRLSRHTASRRAATHLTMPASAKAACSTLPSGRSTVSTSTAACSAIVSASPTTRQTALHPAMTAVRRSSPAPPGRSPTNGRARNTRNSTPPSAIDWLRMTRP